MKNKEEKTKKTNKNTNLGHVGIIGAGLAGVAAMAYYFFGPEGKKNQQQAKVWALKMKAEVIEKLERVQEMSEPTYRSIIDRVAMKYQQKTGSSPEEVKKLAKDLKGHWTTLVKPQAEKIVVAKKVSPKSKKGSAMGKNVVAKAKKIKSKTKK